ncbi:hypothetical protein [Bacillus sp. J33]|uniref:hypothetical protein n=1 Tax=Bacillus sp. J33 TaxID=935836 RepID=UPI00047B5AFA|nr:hypothetical protein [Bacillus sp. J33]
MSVIYSSSPFAGELFYFRHTDFAEMMPGRFSFLVYDCVSNCDYVTKQGANALILQQIAYIPAMIALP